MDAPTVENPWVAVGSYEGVFYFSEDFIQDLALTDLDGDIYANDNDLTDEDVAYDDDDMEAVIVTDRQVGDGEVTVTGVNTYDDDNFNRYNRYDIDLKSVK